MSEGITGDGDVGGLSCREGEGKIMKEVDALDEAARKSQS